MNTQPRTQDPRRPGMALIAVLAALAAIFVFPRAALAGEYVINACQADRSAATVAFEDRATRGMLWRRACSPIGPGVRGLVTANVPRNGRVARGSYSAFVLDAPPGTVLGELRWSGHVQRRDCRYALQLYAVGPDGGSVAVRNVRANRNCPKQKMAQASGWPSPRSFDLAGATRIVQRTICVGGAGSRRFCSARGHNFIRTFTAQITVIDPAPPTASVLFDSPFAVGNGWRDVKLSVMRPQTTWV